MNRLFSYQKIERDKNMNGINVHYKCPYCNNTITTQLGHTTYYQYQNKTVIITSHDNCGKFICEVYPETDDIIEMRHQYPSRKYKWAAFIKNATINHMYKEMTDDDIIKTVISEMNLKFEKNIIEKDINDIKTFIQIILGNKPTEKPWSIPLTNEIEKQLTYKSTTCW